MKVNKKLIISVILVSLLAANIAVTIWLCIRVNQDENKSYSTKYTLYVGLNDNETYNQEISTDDAKELIDIVCTKYVSGFTISEANGMWVDETGKETHENTIVCYFDDINDETIHKIADELLNKLNQNGILTCREQEIPNLYRWWDELRLSRHTCPLGLYTI